MLSRLFALLVLLAVLGAAVYAWRVRPGGAPPLGTAARDLGSEARELGAEAKGKLGEARDKLGELGQGLRDTKVTASVKTALGLNRNLRPQAIEVKTENGVVTLGGRVDSAELRAQAEAVASAVPDVGSVVNQIQVSPGGSAPAGRTLGEGLDDHMLQMQVKLALSLNRELKGSDISVDVVRREVTLGGTATTPAQRDLALRIARDTGAVANVVDRIQLPGAPAAAGPPPAAASMPNAERAAAAARALKSNANLSGFDLQVRDESGRLVLRGQVRTAAEKDLAGLIAREAAGVPVENAVEVRLEPAKDGA